MGIVTGIWLAVLGVLGAASLIIAKRPDAKGVIDKLTPYQGWIGAASAIWGVWWIVNALINISLLSTFPIWWITWLGSGAVMLLLGFLLGVGVMKTFIKDPTANEKMDQTITKLAPYQGNLGLLSIGIGIWSIIASIAFSH